MARRERIGEAVLVPSHLERGRGGVVGHRPIRVEWVQHVVEHAVAGGGSALTEARLRVATERGVDDRLPPTRVKVARGVRRVGGRAEVMVAHGVEDPYGALWRGSDEIRRRGVELPRSERVGGVGREHGVLGHERR